MMFSLIMRIEASQVQANLVTINLKGHSLKKLDVSGSEMILIQAFINKNVKIFSQHDHLGLSQKGELVSFYMDYERAPLPLKIALEEHSYIRGQERISDLLQQSFQLKKGEKEVLVNFRQ
jgi:hypothetical protein